MNALKKPSIKLFLASTSPRRKELLGHWGEAFEIINPQVEEICSQTDPAKYVKELAEKKARAGSKLIKEGVVIGADTIVYLAGEIIEKPKDKQQAYKILKKLSGNTHQVFTGVSFIQKNGIEENFFEMTKVSFSIIEEDFLDKYIDSGEPMDKSGAYGIQGMALSFINKIEGCYANVVGFPLAKAYQVWLKIKKAGN